MALSGRQVAILLVGLALATLLALVGALDPFCDYRGRVDGACLVQDGNRVVAIDEPPSAVSFILAAVVAVASIVLAFSPWARRPLRDRDWSAIRAGLGIGAVVAALLWFVTEVSTTAHVWVSIGLVLAGGFFGALFSRKPS